MSDKREKSSDNEMTFFEHIEALRPHLVRGVMALIVVMIAAFIGKKFIIDTILMGPQSPDFPTNRWLCDFSYAVFGDNRVCDRHCRGGTVPVVGDMAFCRAGADRTRTPQKQDVRAVCVALLFCRALFRLFPDRSVVGQFLRRIPGEPRNHQHDRRAFVPLHGAERVDRLRGGVPASAAGLFPGADGIDSFLRRYRRHALILLCIISAIITPPDIFSLLLVVIPLYGLYECSILLAGRVERQKAREEAAENVAGPAA